MQNGNNNSNNNGGGGRYEPTKRTGTLSVRKDHINELGFANDGYDYSQHLREIGTYDFQFTYTNIYSMLISALASRIHNVQATVAHLSPRPVRREHLWIWQCFLAEKEPW